MTSGQRVKGHRENWPLTLLDPIYCYNGRATVSTPCQKSVEPHIKWLHHASRKSIHRLITRHIESGRELMLTPEMHASHVEKNYFVPRNEKICQRKD